MKKDRVTWAHRTPDYDRFDIEGETFFFDPVAFDFLLDYIEKASVYTSFFVTTNKVINWSHQSKKTRFKINIGVAYGSDVDLVVKVLKESAVEHPELKDEKLVDVRFAEFNNSSLDFQILFFSENIFRIEKVKSDIRKTINRKLKENGITIPFPQMDLHLKSNDTDMFKNQ